MPPAAPRSRPDPAAMPSEQQKKTNLRLALVLASIALVFFLGFIAKSAFFG
jgi:hypothetical protein